MLLPAVAAVMYGGGGGGGGGGGCGARVRDCWASLACKRTAAPAPIRNGGAAARDDCGRRLGAMVWFGCAHSHPPRRASDKLARVEAKDVTMSGGRSKSIPVGHRMARIMRRCIIALMGRVDEIRV